MLRSRAVPINSLLTLLDDIAIVLDDVATLTKAATKKTAGVLGDDLALNAEQVSGVRPERELPVVLAVAKGSALNKAVLVPAALLVSAFAPWAVTPLLMIGGAFLCFEGFEKVAHKLFARGSPERAARHAALVRAVADPSVDLVEFEKKKVRGAVRTDFILSAEILVISLGTLTDATLAVKAAVLVVVALLMTVGVYGLVAGIVKLDDLGLALRRREGGAARAIGAWILRGAPYLMKGLGVAGTIAMFLVGGSIIAHGVPALHALVDRVSAQPGVVGLLGPTAIEALAGVVVGAAITGAVVLARRLLPRSAPPPDGPPPEES